MIFYSRGDFNETNQITIKRNELKLTEGIPTANILKKDINKWYTMASNIFPELEKAFVASIKKQGVKNNKLFLEAFKDAVKYADLSFKKLDLIVKFIKKAGL